MELGGKRVIIPESIKKCSQLKALHIKAESISLPESLVNLSSLKELDLRGNVIDFPDITSLSSLVVVILPRKLMSDSIKEWMKSLNLVYERTVDGSCVYKKH
jgi:Leucine-rich repeat (LRR) protein